MGRFFNDEAALNREIGACQDAELANLDPKLRVSKSAPRLGLLAELGCITKGTIFGTAKTIARRTLELHDDLERRVAALEAAPLAYKGTHEPGLLYERNSIVTRDGSMWIALRRTQQRPGDGGDGWQLCVKAGKDAR